MPVCLGAVAPGSIGRWGSEYRCGPAMAARP
jgi:hypothetical protein